MHTYIERKASMYVRGEVKWGERRNKKTGKGNIVFSQGYRRPKAQLTTLTSKPVQ